MKPRRRLLLVPFLLSALIAAPPAEAAPGDITLVSWFPLDSMCTVSDVWGFQDVATDSYYVLVGEVRGRKLHIINVTDGSNPRRVALVRNFPTTDVKTWTHPITGRTYAYGCDDKAAKGCTDTHQSAILDITIPDDPEPVGSPFHQGHNISITDDGFMTVSTRFCGSYLYDLNPDAESPDLIWSDGCVGCDDAHDSTPKSDVLYSFNGREGVDVWDISGLPDSAPTLLSTVPHGGAAGNDPYQGVFSHSGDATDDGAYLYICDESAFFNGNVGDIYVWDIYSNPPAFVDSIWDINANVHNMYNVGGFGFVSFYTAGFRVYDVSLPTIGTPLLDEFDTSPSFSGPGFGGNWGVYPFDDRGYVYASDSQTGLFVFAVEGYTQVPVIEPGPPGPPSTLVTGAIRAEGGTPIPGVTVTFDCDCPWPAATTDANGVFAKVVPYNWKGTVTPQPASGYTYTFNATGQPFADYTSGVTGDRLNQDFTRHNPPPPPPPCRNCEISEAIANPLANLEAAPNPFSRSTSLQFELARPAIATVRVIDVRGRMIRDVELGSLRAGPNRWTWDGTDASGRIVGAGVYFVVVEARASADIKRVVRLE